jgi:hypothetical protein
MNDSPPEQASKKQTELEKESIQVGKPRPGVAQLSISS